MKNFERFAHQGVKSELLRLKALVSAFGEFNFGSSGDGEITIQGSNVTAYARKYKVQNGWRLVICKSGKEVETFPSTIEDVADRIKRAIA